MTAQTTYLRNGVCSHETENMCLDPLIQANHGQQLRCVEGAGLLHLHTTLERLASETRDNVAQVGRQFVPEPMINIQLIQTGWRKVHVVDFERRLNECLVMSLHGQLSRCSLPSTGTDSLLQLGCRDSTGRDVELSPEVLNIQVERQILLAEIATQEFPEELAQLGLFHNVAKTISVALLHANPLVRVIAGIQLFSH